MGKLLTTESLEKIGKGLCPECDGVLRTLYEAKTLVGYASPLGHDHDDNCVKRYYECENKHRLVLSIRVKCPNPDCNWVGRADCGCHNHTKLDKWPGE